MSDNSGTEPPETAQATGDKTVTLGDETELIAVCGFPGVGKSTVSKYLADRLEGKRLRSDEIRKELFPEPTYSTEESETVYRTCFERAGERLAEGQTVVLDASFASSHHRGLAEEVARECETPFRLIHVACREEEVIDRIERRDGISDADVDIYYQVRKEFEPIERDHLRIDNSGTWANTVERIDSRLPET